MGYNVGRSLGEVSSWLGLLTSPQEVYVYRAHAANLPLTAPTNALLLVRAIGLVAGDLDVRAIALKNTGSDAWDFDVIMTSKVSNVWFVPRKPQTYTDAILSNAQVRLFAPNLQVSNAQLAQLTAPPESIDFWRSQPLLWDQALKSEANQSGPTDAFAVPSDYNIVLGQADDGPRTKPWKLGSSNSLSPSVQPSSSKSYAWLAVVAVAAGIAWLEYSKKKKRTS